MPLWVNDPDLFINNIGPHQYQLEAEQESIDVSSLSTKVPDPNWFTVDNKGHFHTFADDDSLPTLEMHSEIGVPISKCDGCDWTEEPGLISYYRCRLCKNVVVPHFVSGWSKNESIPGLMSITLTVEHFGQNVEIGETVSWYNKTHFGTGKVMSIHLKTGVELIITCDYMAKRKHADL